MNPKVIPLPFGPVELVTTEEMVNLIDTELLHVPEGVDFEEVVIQMPPSVPFSSDLDTEEKLVYARKKQKTTTIIESMKDVSDEFKIQKIKNFTQFGIAGRLRDKKPDYIISGDFTLNELHKLGSLFAERFGADGKLVLLGNLVGTYTEACIIDPKYLRLLIGIVKTPVVVGWNSIEQCDIYEYINELKGTVIDMNPEKWVKVRFNGRITCFDEWKKHIEKIKNYV